MSFPLLGNPKPQFFDSSGNPLTSGTLAVLEPTDDTNKASYPTADDADAATNANVNPVVLDSRGEPPNGLFGVSGQAYKLTLKDSAGTTIWTVDDVSQHPFYPTTTSETTQGITPTDFSYPQGNVKRYGAVGDGVTDDGTALQNASDSFTIAATGSGGGTVVIPEGTYLFATGWTPPNNVRIEGASKRGTRLNYTGTGTAIKFGTSDSVLNTGCALHHLSIIIDDPAATAVLLNATNGAFIEDVYIEGAATPFDNTRTSIGVDIDGRNISTFFNTVKDVNCVHVHTGFRVGTTGTTNATTTNFFNCQAFCDVATDDAGVGVHIGAASSIAQGDGGSWYGGNIEDCATGLYCTINAYPMSFVGARFENNTVDILLDSGCPAMNFIGLVQFLGTEVTDNSGNDQNFVGCTQSTLVTYNKIPRLGYTKPIENVTTTNVITAAESGTTFYLNAAGGFTSTLPAPANGLHYTFIVRTAPSGGNYVITTNAGANVLNGFYLDVVGELVSFNAMDTLNFVDGTSLQSDRLELECDGNTWHCKAFSKVDGGITVSVT